MIRKERAHKIEELQSRKRLLEEQQYKQEKKEQKRRQRQKEDDESYARELEEVNKMEAILEEGKRKFRDDRDHKKVFIPIETPKTVTISINKLERTKRKKPSEDIASVKKRLQLVENNKTHEDAAKISPSGQRKQKHSDKEQLKQQEGLKELQETTEELRLQKENQAEIAREQSHQLGDFHRQLEEADNRIKQTEDTAKREMNRLNKMAEQLIEQDLHQQRQRVKRIQEENKHTRLILKEEMKQVQLGSKKTLQLELESNAKHQRDKQHRLGQEEEDLLELLTDSGSSDSEEDTQTRKQEGVES